LKKNVGVQLLMRQSPDPNNEKLSKYLGPHYMADYNATVRVFNLDYLIEA
jgi:hypothetical protein